MTMPAKTLGQIAYEAFWERYVGLYPKLGICWEGTGQLTQDDWEASAKAVIEEAGRRIENQIAKGRYK